MSRYFETPHIVLAEFNNNCLFISDNLVKIHTCIIYIESIDTIGKDIDINTNNIFNVDMYVIM